MNLLKSNKIGFTIFLFLLTFLVSTCAVNKVRNKVDTPDILLQKIYNLSSKKKYDELKECIYPFQARGINLQEEIINGIKGETKNPDFEYSDEALALIISEHLERIKPIDDELLQKIFIDGEYGKDEKLNSIAKNNPENIKIFDYKGVHILMAKIDSEYKLLFWEDLNYILENNQTEDIIETDR